MAFFAVYGACLWPVCNSTSERLHTHSQAVDSLIKNYTLCFWLYQWFGGN